MATNPRPTKVSKKRSIGLANGVRNYFNNFAGTVRRGFAPTEILAAGGSRRKSLPAIRQCHSVQISVPGMVARAFGHEIPQITSPDWSRGKITNESDGVHNWSKGIGGNAVLIMPWTKLPAVVGSWAGAAKGAIIGRSAAAAEAAQVAAAEGGAARAGTQVFDAATKQLAVLNPNCFAAGTPVLTPKGAVPIEALRPGDLVLARTDDDPESPVKAHTVGALFELTATVCEVWISGKRIETTLEHPFYVARADRNDAVRCLPRHLADEVDVAGKGWTRAGSLKPGDLVLGHTEKLGQVERVVETDRVATVYNLSVEDDHTYFVGEFWWGFSVWVHNAPCLPLLQHYLGGSGGRWGSIATRQLNDRVAKVLESLGFRVTGGAGRAAEELIAGPGGQTLGGTWVDITATNGASTVRVQTVTTLADGVTLTAAEAAAGARISANFPGDILIFVSKITGSVIP